MRRALDTNLALRRIANCIGYQVRQHGSEQDWIGLDHVLALFADEAQRLRVLVVTRRYTPVLFQRSHDGNCSQAETSK
jgi:hypothetical protein